MSKKKRKRKKNYRQNHSPERSSFSFLGLLAKPVFAFKKAIAGLPGRMKRYLLSSTAFLLALVVFLSFFDLSGRGGEFAREILIDLSGQAVYLAPLVFVIISLVFLLTPKKLLFAGFLGIFLFLIGVMGILEVLDLSFFSGGRIGKLETKPLINLFGELVSFFVFLVLTVVGFLSLANVLSRGQAGEEEKKGLFQSVKQVFDASKFKVLKVEPEKTGLEDKKKIGVEIVEPGELKRKGIRKSLPPFELLEDDKEKAQPGDIGRNSAVIKKTLEDFGIDVSMAEVNVGPTVTQYTLKPAEGVKLSKITGLSNNLALALAAHPIRIEAPIPGRSLVGVEIPNSIRSKVRLKNLVSHPDFKRKYSHLAFALGRDVSGKALFADIVRMPHLLVAGATGTGKTVFLNSLIVSLLYKNTPETLRLVLIDPKRVEFSIYRDLPHLLCPVVCDSQQSINALSWLIEEMERRFRKLAEYDTRNIKSFNERAKQNGEESLYNIVLIVDEMADLMVARGKEMETKVVRIAQMARAVGIHLILATQRPSTEVITGLIKANINCRVSFQVPTQIDSRTVLDMAGSEKLLGAGDMLYISPEIVLPRRIQGAYVSEEEVKKVTNWIKEEVGTRSLLEDDLTRGLKEFLEEIAPGPLGIGGDMRKDALYEQAKQIVVRNQKASASLLQRRLQIGYVRAARLLDMLEMDGIVGPSQGAKARKVYFKQEDEEELYE